VGADVDADPRASAMLPGEAIRQGRCLPHPSGLAGTATAASAARDHLSQHTGEAGRAAPAKPAPEPLSLAEEVPVCYRRRSRNPACADAEWAAGHLHPNTEEMPGVPLPSWKD